MRTILHAHPHNALKLQVASSVPNDSPPRVLQVALIILDTNLNSSLEPLPTIPNTHPSQPLKAKQSLVVHLTTY